MKQLTPAELLGKVRMSNTFLDYTSHNREFRLHALAKLIWQQVSDNLPVVLPNTANVIGIDAMAYQDMT